MNTGGTIDQLTERERQVFLMVVDGLTNSAIADRLQISRRTVETHIRTVLRKMGVTRRSELISTYLREQNEQPSHRGKMWLKETPRTHPWSDQLQRLVDRGDNDAAFQLITGLVEVEHSWELVLDILRVGEILGRPTEALRYAAVVEDALDGQPVSFGVERAIWFYRGRILYHLGLYRYAMDFYRRNIPDGESGLGIPINAPAARHSRTCSSGSRRSAARRPSSAGSTTSSPRCSIPTCGSSPTSCSTGRRCPASAWCTTFRSRRRAGCRWTSTPPSTSAPRR